MTEMAFALDGLYAAGWWPSVGDDCRRSADDRWIPSASTIYNAFAAAQIELRIVTPVSGHPITIRWNTPGRGPCTITARDPDVALIMAYTQIFAASPVAVLQD